MKITKEARDLCKRIDDGVNDIIAKYTFLDAGDYSISMLHLDWSWCTCRGTVNFVITFNGETYCDWRKENKPRFEKFFARAIIRAIKDIRRSDNKEVWCQYLMQLLNITRLAALWLLSGKCGSLPAYAVAMLALGMDVKAVPWSDNAVDLRAFRGII